MLESILSTASANIDLTALLLCTATSLGLGLLTALVYMVKNTYTKGFVITLALLPAMVQLVILLVNGNLGAGVAVAGAFSLVRFRSAAGSAREISGIFLAMAIGLATGMGYLLLAVIFWVVLAAANLLLGYSRFGEPKAGLLVLKLTVPEDVDYTEAFSDLFAEFTTHCERQKVRTTNLGSLFELQYQVLLRDPSKEKAFIDQLRCRNGNLAIALQRPGESRQEL